MDNEVISIAAAFARCLRARHLDVSVALGCKPFARRNVFAVTDDTINRDSEFADEERGHQSKDYENQTKTDLAEFRPHTRALGKPAATHSWPGLVNKIHHDT